MVIGPLTTFRRFVPDAADPDAADVGFRPMASCMRAPNTRLPKENVGHCGSRSASARASAFTSRFLSEPSIWIAAAIGIAGVACAILSVRSVRAGLSVTLAAVAAISLGFAYAKLRIEWVAAPVLSHKIGPAGLSRRIESVQVHGKGVRVVLGAVESQRLRSQAPARVRVSIRAASDVLVPGNWVHLTAILMPPPGPAAPGGYDFGRAAFFDRIGGVGFAYGRAAPISPLRAETLVERVSTSIALLRWRMTEPIQAALPGAPAASPPR